MSMPIDGLPTALILFDMIPSEQKAEVEEMYRNKDIILACFDVASPSSFTNLRQKWIPQIRHHLPATPILLVGLQCDLRTDEATQARLLSQEQTFVTPQTAREYGREISATYLECSAVTQERLREVFVEATRVGREFKSRPPKKKSCVLL